VTKIGFINQMSAQLSDIEGLPYLPPQEQNTPYSQSLGALTHLSSISIDGMLYGRHK